MPRISDALDKPPGLPPRSRIEARGQFVQHHDARRADQGQGSRHTLVIFALILGLREKRRIARRMAKETPDENPEGETEDEDAQGATQPENDTSAENEDEYETHSPDLIRNPPEE